MTFDTFILSINKLRFTINVALLLKKNTNINNDSNGNRAPFKYSRLFSFVFISLPPFLTLSSKEIPWYRIFFSKAAKNPVFFLFIRFYHFPGIYHIPRDLPGLFPKCLLVFWEPDPSAKLLNFNLILIICWICTFNYHTTWQKMSVQTGLHWNPVTGFLIVQSKIKC